MSKKNQSGGNAETALGFSAGEDVLLKLCEIVVVGGRVSEVVKRLFGAVPPSGAQNRTEQNKTYFQSACKV